MTAEMADLPATLTAEGPIALIAVTLASFATAIIGGQTGFGGRLGPGHFWRGDVTRALP